MAGTKSPGARDQAKKFLTDLLLASGQMLKTEIEEAADAHGISHRTLVRAKDELSVIVEKEKGKGNKGKWVWRLPDCANRPTAADRKVVPMSEFRKGA